MVEVFGVEEVLKNLRGVQFNTAKAVIENSQAVAGRMEAHSKMTRPWTDRTGNARQSIYSFVEVNSDTIKIYHGIRVDYGKYLELSRGGKYRVISPTVNTFRSTWLKEVGASLRS